MGQKWAAVGVSKARAGEGFWKMRVSGWDRSFLRTVRHAGERAQS